MTENIGARRNSQKKKEYIIPCHHFYEEPVQMVKGERQYLYDSTGKIPDFMSLCDQCRATVTRKLPNASASR